MQKRQYERPAVRVMALRLWQQLLNISGEISGYSSGDDFIQDDDEDTSWW